MNNQNSVNTQEAGVRSESGTTMTAADATAFINACSTPAGMLWREWFETIGQHATVEVINATATLVIEEKKLAHSALVAALEHTLTTKHDCRTCACVKCEDSRAALSLARRETK